MKSAAASLHQPSLNAEHGYQSQSVSKNACQCSERNVGTSNLCLLDIWILIMILAHAASIIVGQCSPGGGHGVWVLRRRRRGLWI